MAQPILPLNRAPYAFPGRSRPRHRSWGAALAIAALLGGLAGPADACRPEESLQGDGTPAIAQAQPQAQPQEIITLEGNWRTELIDAGQAPYQELRLRPTQGDRQTMTARLAMQGTMVVNGQTTPAPNLPDIEMVLSAVVERIDANGDVHYTLQYDRLGTVAGTGDSAFPTEIFEAAFAPFRGLKFRIHSSDRGQVKAVEVDSATELNPMARQMIDQLSQSLDNLSAQFPEEAVGNGARWRVVGALTAGGITLNQTVEFRITEMAGDRVTLAMSLDQASGSDSPSTISSTGNGTMIIDWTRLLPLVANLAIESTAIIDGGEAMGRIESTSQIDMTATSSEP